jgi:hypothetical protein
MSLGVCFLVIAARAPRNLLKEVLILSVPLRFGAVLLQLRLGEKWFNVAVFEGVVGVINGVCALLME